MYDDGLDGIADQKVGEEPIVIMVEAAASAAADVSSGVGHSAHPLQALIVHLSLHIAGLLAHQLAQGGGGGGPSGEGTGGQCMPGGSTGAGGEGEGGDGDGGRQTFTYETQ